MTDLNKQPARGKRPLGSIVAAAMALPGVHFGDAHAESAPERGLLAVKVLHYEDSQPGLDRIKVNAPSLYVLAPLGSSWSIEGSTVLDNVSGASPRWHTAVSGASKMHDVRHASDFKVTRYGERSSVSLGASHSNEHDYLSNAVSADASFSSEDNNSTVNVGVGVSRDTINPVNQIVVDDHKRTTEIMLGFTQALSPTDLAQINITHSNGQGYFNDPYKLLDYRPRKREQTAALLRWNHHFADWGSTLRSSYRYYHDSYAINAHTLQFEWVQPVGQTFSVTPLLRLYSQSAASFYFDPVYDPTLGEPYPAGYDVNKPLTYSSADQRLSAFGAITVGLKVDAKLGEWWAADAKYERYEQRGDWRVGGTGSPGLAPFRATFVQLGMSRKF